MAEANWTWNEEIVVAILTGGDIDETVNRLTKRKREEASEYESELKAQAANTRLLVAGLAMPEGSPGRRMADTIIQELREKHPDAAKKADGIIARRLAAAERELDWVVSK